jgi:hypothetical protein
MLLETENNIAFLIRFTRLTFRTTPSLLLHFFEDVDLMLNDFLVLTLFPLLSLAVIRNSTYSLNGDGARDPFDVALVNFGERACVQEL